MLFYLSDQQLASVGLSSRGRTGLRRGQTFLTGLLTTHTGAPRGCIAYQITHVISTGVIVRPVTRPATRNNLARIARYTRPERLAA